MSRQLIYPLTDAQAGAVEPQDSVWLSASAGTGKTQVLSARVLRLLLQADTDPSQILCLTFTKAGAAEMATRVNEVLASWVRMPAGALAQDLQAIGAPVDPDTQARARTRFASVLDCPGGGLRIDTIHAFSQWLLAAFPEEAGLAPGTQPMEDRDRDLLAHEVLAAMLVEAQQTGDRALLDALAMLSVRWGPDGVRGWLMRCAASREMWFGKGSWRAEDIPARTKQVLGLAADASLADAEAMCGDDRFPVNALRNFVDAMRAWGTANGTKYADAAADWLAMDPAGRLGAMDQLLDSILKKDGTPRGGIKKPLEQNPALAEWQDEVAQAYAAIAEFATLLNLSEWFAQALAIGRSFALRWDEAKTREGFIDFDDQIRQAAALLNTSDLSGWIRYKLDRRFNHILIDEAQDTNQSQWDIIRALTEDFFAGAGQREGKLRTIFVVGDYKQAIFRFQGTSPQNFALARDYYERIIGDAASNAARLRERTTLRPLQELPLGRSYRTSQPVLDFVDMAIAEIGPLQFGLSETPGVHRGDVRPGQVVLWRPVPVIPQDMEAEDAAEDSWVSAPERRMADRIADQVKGWIGTYPLYKGGERTAQAGDILVLVRKRKELAGLIVARLHAAGVPVAGVDRLRLGAPLAVKDLMAALRFAAQPLDDLSLACLLVSPLVGWSQEQLLEHGYRGGKVALWDHVRKSDTPEVMAVADRLRDLLKLADYETPQALLHWLLLGPWQGRAKLVARLGREAADPIDELLGAAHAYAAAHTPSLAGFIQWFDAGDGELKREAGASEGLVRVMTVHGAKGLQAPIVILADATGDPDASPIRDLSLSEDGGDGEGRAVPLPSLSAKDRVGPIAAAQEAAKREEREEHWRLLYVAMTRAEEALFIGGALNMRDKDGEPKADSWFARLTPLVDGLPETDPVWGWRLTHGEAPPAIQGNAAGPVTAPQGIAIPDWARQPIGPEPRPPRPLAPSSVGEDIGARPPLPAQQVAIAARRGVLIHALLERLPDVPQAERRERAEAWLLRQARELDEAQRREMVDSALAVLDDPQFAAIFSPDALAEVPLAATVEGQVVAGNADRLLVEETRVTVVDFKTARRPPSSLADLPGSVLAQMGAYAAALAVIYPGREIRAAVLYTQTPELFEIDPEILAAHKPRVSRREESFALPGVE